jgi:hypothetical protein
VETLQDSIEVNKLDIKLPQGELMLRKKKEKTRREQLGLGLRSAAETKSASQLLLACDG